MSDSGCIVFAVDDDPLVRDSLADLLDSAGFTVLTFGSATDFLRSERPDLPACLILDVELPGLSGLDLQAELTKSGVDMPIIFLTGRGDIPMSVRAMKAGAVEFLTKPFRKPEFLGAVSDALLRDREIRSRRAEIAALEKRRRTLTPREHQVMALVVTGLLNKRVLSAKLRNLDQTLTFCRRV